MLRAALFELVEDAPAVVVRDDDHEVGSRLVGADEQSVVVVQEGQVAHEGQRRASSQRLMRQGGAPRGGHQAVDPVGAPISDHAQAIAPAGDHLDLADRPRGSHEHQGVVRGPVPDLGGHGDPVREPVPATSAVTTSAAAASAACQSRQPRGVRG